LTFFVSSYNFCLAPPHFRFPFAWNIIFHAFSFSFCMSFLNEVNFL
jgi:hypothetical protein